MTADHAAAIRAAIDALAGAILAAVRAEAVSHATAPGQPLSIDRTAELAGIGRTTIYAAIGAGRPFGQGWPSPPRCRQGNR